MQVDLGNIITIGVILVTWFVNMIRSKTKIEMRLDSIDNRLDKQNGRIEKTEDRLIEHIEFHEK